MLANFMGFYASVGRSLDRKLYEAVYLRISLINGCTLLLAAPHPGRQNAPD